MFRYGKMTLGNRNFISPQIKKSLQHLTQTGITDRYILLTEARARLQYVKKFGEEIYSRFAVKLNSGNAGATTSRLSYSANEDESLSALLHVVALCSIVVLVGAIALALKRVAWCEKLRMDRILKRNELKRDSGIKIKVMGSTPFRKDVLTSD